MRVRMMMRRPSAWFVAACAFGSLAWVTTVRSVASGDGTPVLVASRDLSTGSDPAQPAATRVQTIPSAGRLPGMLVSVAEVAGRALVAPVAAGEPITDASLGGSPGHQPRPLSHGERALSVPATAAGAALQVMVSGAMVDVVASPGGPDEHQVVIEAAEVIAVTAPHVGDVGDAGALLLRMSASDALRLSASMDSGAFVRVLPRPYEEVAP